jgi:Holliday junction resolvasome RuvABC endonuclease subunit
MKALCLDLGTTSGWALGEWKYNDKAYDMAILSGVMSFRLQRWEGGGMRYLRFAEWLNEMKRHGFDAVFYEEVRRHTAVDAAHVYGGMMGTLTAWCEDNKKPYSGVPVGTIKKHITGAGNASKEKVIAAVRAHGHKPMDHNEADAIALASYVLYNQPGFKVPKG